MSFLINSKTYFVIMLIFVAFAECFAVEKIENNKIPKIWNVNNVSEYFVGREKQIKDCYLQLSKNKKVAIVGGPGFGTSQIAKKYAQIYKHHYDLVWWFDVSRDIEEQMNNLAMEWNRNTIDNNLQINIHLPANIIVEQLKDRLRVTNLAWLLIFDDVMDENQIAAYLPENHNHEGKGDVIIISTNLTAWQQIIKIDEFTPAESIELLTKITKENDLEDAALLADNLKNYPLAVAQAASYIKQHPGLNMKQYNQIFLNNRNELWKWSNSHKSKHQVLDNNDLNVYTTLFLSVEKLKAESPEAFHLLVLCSMLNNKKIPIRFLKEYLADNYSSNSLRKEEAVSYLLKYALLSKDETETTSKVEDILDSSAVNLDETLTINATVQSVIQEMIVDEKNKHLAQALASMAKFLPNRRWQSNSVIDKYDFLLAHIDTLVSYAEKQKIYNEDLIIILEKQLGYYLANNRDLVSSARIINKIEEALKQTKTVNNRVLCRFHLLKGIYYDWKEADYQKALKETEIALELFIDEEDGSKEELFPIYNGLCHLYNHLGNNDEALKYAKLGEELVKQYPEHSDYQKMFLHSLAKIYVDKGDFKEGLHYISRASNIALENSRELAMRDLPILILEVEILWRTKQIDKAYTKIKSLYLSVNDLFPNDDHLLKGHIMISYGYLSALVNNNFQEAKTILLKGQKIIQDLTGEAFYKRKIAALSYKFLGCIYELDNQYSKAQVEYLKAENLYKNNTYSSSAAGQQDISDVYTRLAEISVKLQDQPMAQHYLDLHRKDFGYEHERTKEITKLMFEAKMQIDF